MKCVNCNKKHIVVKFTSKGTYTYDNKINQWIHTNNLKSDQEIGFCSKECLEHYLKIPTKYVLISYFYKDPFNEQTEYGESYTKEDLKHILIEKCFEYKKWLEKSGYKYKYSKKDLLKMSIDELLKDQFVLMGCEDYCFEILEK